MMSDGFQLLQVPGRTSEQLEPHLFTSPLLQGYTQFEDGDFAGAQAVCMQGLQRVPENVHLAVLLSSCRSYTHDYAGSLTILRPLLHSQANTDPGIFAAIENNIAFALVMSNPHAHPNSETVIEADRLSAHAFSLYPCVLANRSTRALVLTARGQPEKALALLEYEHYETGPRTQQAHRETTRAFALRALDQREESQRAAAEAARLSPETVGFLKVLGLASAAAPGESGRPATRTGMP